MHGNTPASRVTKLDSISTRRSTSIRFCVRTLFQRSLKKIGKRGKTQTTVWFDRLTDVVCRNLDRGEL